MWQQIKFIVLVICVGALSGCATGPGDNPASLVLGEHVAYRVVNLAGQPVLEMPTLVDKTGGQILFSTLRLRSQHPQKPQAARLHGEFEPSPAMVPVRVAGVGLVKTALMLPDRFGQDPGDDNLALPAARVNVAAIMPNGHRVPEEVELTWRREPLPGQAVLGGNEQTPVRIPLRARIPAWVLEQVSDQWRYRLDLDVVVGAENVVHLRWRVLCFSDGSLHEIGRGGQW